MIEPLSFQAVRVLGVLMEKELSTPDYYPMTLNALVAGCNQKSSRDPVVEYGETTVMEALDELVKRRLAGHASVAGSRAEKYRHAAQQALGLDERSMAVLASLMLRGPETIGELRSRTSRMASFDSMEEVEAVIAALSERDEEAAICREKDGSPEYDIDLRDYENVPLDEDVTAYFEREVKPYVPEAWVDESYTDERDGRVGRVGYEINFNRYFYEYEPPRPLEEIEAEIRTVEKEIVGLLGEVGV